jgi:hypothetical protein
MANNLKNIWSNRKQILEGITNSLIRDEFVEDVAKARLEICDNCPNKDIEGTECVMPGSKPCCGLCGCSLTFKTRSLSSECPDGKWKALMTEEEEDQLDNLKD